MDGAEPLCHTKNGSLPWADGTPCGPGHLCWDGSCLPEEEVDRPKVRDSHLGVWKEREGEAVFKEETTLEGHELRDFGLGCNHDL